MLLVTGSAGFIGSNFVLDWLKTKDEPVVSLDKLTYAGNVQNLQSLEGDDRHHFVQGDICDLDLLNKLFATYQPSAVVHFAAESHVDRSIHGPDLFVQTNIKGTFTLLEAARAYWNALDNEEKAAFRFLHISTDEVYGSLGENDPAFTESSPFRPNSPYAASKAAADHLVRAHYYTYGLPTVTTNCSNNFGPFQFPEKLIPFMIHRALSGESLPVYGDGQNIRDWLYVTDHCAALHQVLAKGRPGQTYNVGGRSEVKNIDLVRMICAKLDSLHPRQGGGSYAEQIAFVTDRPGHDRRYALNPAKLESELGWQPQHLFETALNETISWYLTNREWVQNILDGSYRQWVKQNYETGLRKPA